MSRDRWVILSDIHVPYDDTKLLLKITEWIRGQQLAGLILNGDVLDCHAISRFINIHHIPFEDEVARGQVLIDMLADAARANNPQVALEWQDGNHEARLAKWMAANASELQGLLDANGDQIISIPHLMGLRKRGWAYRPYQRTRHLVGSLYVEHGHRVSKHSGYAVKNTMTDNGASLVMGHVHRVGSHLHTTRNGLMRGYEQGCLCRTDPPYLHERAVNWQQGLCVVDIYPDKSWWVQQVLVIDGDFVVDGVRY